MILPRLLRFDKDERVRLFFGGLLLCPTLFLSARHLSLRCRAKGFPLLGSFCVSRFNCGNLGRTATAFHGSLQRFNGTVQTVALLNQKLDDMFGRHLA